MKSYFEKQVQLLLDVLGTVLSDSNFALKGGTAINFFYTDMPRLSVDIDLSYTKINSREEFLKDNKTFFERLAHTLSLKHNLLVQVKNTQDGIPKQMVVSSQEAEIKVEVNLVLRGCLYPTVIKETCETIKKKYEMQLNLPTLSFEDLYAGKFCAALDRQHPRDLFDVMIFFQSNSITDKLKKAFLGYLISGNRPISELIHPNRLDHKSLFEKEFEGMTPYKVSYDKLEAARDLLIKSLDQVLDNKDRTFLFSFKEGDPIWDHVGIPHLKDMPAVKWKLYNIARMSPQKHRKALDELKKKLDL